MEKFVAFALSCILGTCLAGGWDVGSFDNDDALDWVWELTDSDDLTVVRVPLLTAANADGYLEAPAGARAVAAAEVVAALHGKPILALPEEVLDWVAEHDLAVDEELLATARTAVAAVMDVDSSELAQLWADSPEYFAAWQRNLERLLERLR